MAQAIATLIQTLKVRPEQGHLRRARRTEP